jgi:hypothetical protein
MRVFTNVFKIGFLSITTILFLTITSYAQVSNVITQMNVGEAKEGEDLAISVKLLQELNTSQVSLFYRVFGETDYRQTEFAIHGNQADGIIQGSNIALPYLEVYFIVKTVSGEESYPLGAPSKSTPLQIKVGAKSLKDNEVIFLAPEKNSVISQSDFLVSISLIRANNSVDKAATRIYVDETEITKYALFAEDLIVFSAENSGLSFPSGNHSIRVDLFDTEKKPYHSVQSVFTISAEASSKQEDPKFSYEGNVTAESRHESISHQKEWYNNIGAELRGTYQDWNFESKIYVTSEEKGYQQPNDRFSLGVKSDYLQLNVGDHNPNFPSLVLSGKRVRGVSASVTLGVFNIQTSLGEITRKIDRGQIIRTYSATDSLPKDEIIISVDSAKYGAPKAAITELGTYSRNVFAIRPYFGKGENFQFGLTYLHSKDDASSIQFGSSPKENVVVGTDIFFGILDRRITFDAQAAISLLNTDISKGTLSDDEMYNYLDSASAKDINDWKSILSKFITINQFIKPINPGKLSTLAAEASLALNFAPNYFKTGYTYRGNDYVSFGNEYVRTNVAGFNVLDRIRLFDNRLFVSGTFESLRDNLQKTTVATTTFNTATASVSYMPRFDFPNCIVSYGRNDNNNDLGDTSISKIKNHTNRYSAQLSYDFIYKFKNTVSLGFQNSSKDDESLNNNDATNNSISLNSSSYWSDMLITNINFVFNASTIQSKTTEQKLNYLTLMIGARHLFLEQKLSVGLSINPSFGDFKRITTELNSSYAVLKNLSLTFQARLIMNKKIPGVIDEYNDSIIDLTARVTI